VFREIKAQYLFEKETSALRYPQYQDGSFSSDMKLAANAYLSLFSTRTLFYRVAIGSL
jgi:hypothetical protein